MIEFRDKTPSGNNILFSSLVYVPLLIIQMMYLPSLDGCRDHFWLSWANNQS